MTIVAGPWNAQESRRPGTFRTWCIVAMLFVGCRSKPPPPALPPVEGDAASGSATAASLVPAPLTPTQVVERWNSAHVTHDLTALSTLYGPRVQFYGQTHSNKECVAAKKAAFAEAPDYTQTVRDLVVHDGQASFTKTSTSHGKNVDYPAILVVVGGFIVGETDKVTEANLAAQTAKDESWCVDDASVIPRAAAINDKLVPPFKLSAASARAIVLGSKHEQLLAAKFGQTPIAGDVSCPSRCDRTRVDGCSYTFSMVTFPSPDEEMPRWKTVDWIAVDAIDGTLRWEENGADGGMEWKSEGR